MTNKERRKPYAEVAKLYGKNTFVIHEVVKQEKEIYAIFAVIPQSTKVKSPVHD